MHLKQPDTLPPVRTRHSSREGLLGRVASALLVLAAGVLLIACGGGSSSSGSPAAGGQAPGTAEFGMTDAQLVANIEKVESSISSCMTSAGFKYVPIDPATLRAGMSALKAAPGLKDDAFVARFAYGITTNPPGRAFRFGETNDRAYAALSPADQVAYKRTLLGDNADATFTVALDAEDFSGTGGCTRTAVAQAFTPEQLNATYRNPLDVRIEQDPRMVTARKNWTTCMRDKGFDYARQEDAEADLAKRLKTLTGGAEPGTLTGSAKDALAKLQRDERAIAQTDFDCAKRFVDDIASQVERDITGREPA